MKKYLLFLAGISTFAGVNAQINIPEVQAVYGGTIRAITGYARTADTSRIFISTESANSIFYADVSTPSVGTPTFGAFSVLSSTGDDDGFGSGIMKMAVDTASEKLFFIAMGRIYSTDVATGSLDSINQFGIQDLLIVASKLFFVENNKFHFGTLSSTGSYTAGAGSPINLPSSIMNPAMAYSPANSKIYIFSEGSTPKLFKTSDVYSSISSSTTISDISPITLSTTVQWRAMGIGPDGRIFTGGSGPGTKSVAYTDDETTWSEHNTTMTGVAGGNFAFSGTSSSYYVYFSKAYNDSEGTSGNWSEFGMPGGFETHPNDGNVFADPNSAVTVYMTTDQGIGVSIDNGSTIKEIDEGVEAVQVNDFDMSSDKNTAWLASKAGIRRVTTFLTTPTWTSALFPNGDGSPYNSADMNPSDANTAYVGSSRVYKTTNAGSTWSQLFTPENAPYNYPMVGTVCDAIEVCSYNENIVFAGYSIQGMQLGGLFYSHDAGANWNQLLLNASSIGQDADVYDIVFNKEGIDTIAYVGVEAPGTPSAPYSIYKLTKSGSTWTAAQDMTSANTSTGAVIVSTIRDLQVSTSGDSILACGNDVSSSNATTYYKSISGTSKWTPYVSSGSSGLPTGGSRKGSAIALGNDTAYCAVDNEIYIFPNTATQWQLGYSFPIGNQINVLYFDDLLSGTGTGLYGHKGLKPVGIRTINSGSNLLKTYPNPVSGICSMDYELKNQAHVKISVYDCLGRTITTLVNTKQSPGTYSQKWDTQNLPKGIYLVQLQAGNSTDIKKVIVE